MLKNYFEGWSRSEIITSVTAVGFIFAIAVGLLVCWFSHVSWKETRWNSADFSDVVGFDFTMTESGVISYEKRTYGNTLYASERFEDGTKRLDFEPCSPWTDECQHLYFISGGTGTLKTVRYRNGNGHGEWKCEHLSEIISKVDKYNTDKKESMPTIYGTLDGRKCSVHYFRDGRDMISFVSEQ